MKKFLSLLLVFAIVLSFSLCAYADESEAVQESSTEQTESQFETLLLKKGSMILKEYTGCGTIKPDDRNKTFLNINFQTAVLTDIETGNKYKALRMIMDCVNNDYVGVLDSDEIDSAIAALEYIKTHYSEFDDYTEIQYTAKSGMEIGAFTSSNTIIFFIRPDGRNVGMITISDDVIVQFIEMFKTVKSTFEE